MFHIGTAAWGVPRQHAGHFPSDGSHLQKYAAIFNAVEINSTFWRRHKPDTFARWRDTVGESFRFACKVPRTITHEAKLAAPRRLLTAFFDDIRPLGPKLGPVLVQLAPSLEFDPRLGPAFFRTLRSLHDGPVAFEPRHPTWYEPHIEALLLEYRIARVIADPPRPPIAATTAGDPSLLYLRLHGSPRIYYSEYGARIRVLSQSLQTAAYPDIWCIFDNTASGAAAGDALRLVDALSSGTRDVVSVEITRPAE